MSNNTTLVLAYYDIRTFEKNEKYNEQFIMNTEKYLEDIKTVLDLNYPMVIFIEKKFENIIYQNRPIEYHNYTKIIIKDYGNFKFYDKLGKLKENYIKNPVKNLSTIKFTPLYNLLISNKTEFIRNSIENNYFNTEKFAWLDVKAITFLKYFPQDINHLLDINDIPKIFDNFIENRITILEMAFTSKNELTSDYYDYSRGKVAATFFGGYKKTLITFADLVEKEFLKTIENGKCVCEEQIYGWISGEYPELFDPIFGDYGSHFVNNFIIKKDINLVLNYLINSYNNNCYYKTAKCSKLLVNTIEKGLFTTENPELLFNIYNYGYISNYYLNKKQEAADFIFKLLELSIKNIKIYNYIKKMINYFKTNTSYLNNMEVNNKIEEIFSNNLKILYGIENNYRDITKKALIYHAKHNKSSNILHIPTNDNLRASMFGDHIFGVLKHIVIDNQIYDHNTEINIDITELLKTININDLIVKKSDWFDRTVTEPMKKLTMIHNNVMFKHGNLKEEFPEQVMAATFINKDNCVLELGANTGRNTIVIASILENDTNLVTLETDPNTCKMLEENRNINNFNFHIENSALSKRPLIQSGWCTIVSDELKAGHFRVNNITFEELEQKYNKKFDTLVADCEGALYYIFQDFPDMLKNINTVIMENDYWEISQKQKVDEILKQSGFSRVYSQAGGWGPCYNFFFETWKKL